jgi:hypothetical protein
MAKFWKFNKIMQDNVTWIIPDLSGIAISLLAHIGWGGGASPNVAPF